MMHEQETTKLTRSAIDAMAAQSISKSSDRDENVLETVERKAAAMGADATKECARKVQAYPY